MNPSDVAIKAAKPPEPVLDVSGPRLVLGSRIAGDGLAEPIVPDGSTTFGPRGAALASTDGPLAICDTGHHRLLLWHKLPRDDYAPADVLIGQPDFGREGRNAKGDPGPATMNVPTGVGFGTDPATGETILAVADAWNHRVLIWDSIPTRDNQPADVVLGQSVFSGMQINRGGAVGPDTLNWCYGVTIIDGRLVVGDTGNRRVLIWDEIPTKNGQPADMVVGQQDLNSRDENAGEEPGPLGLRWPHAVASSNGRLLVSDAGNNRILVWNEWPSEPGVPADFALGQKNFECLEINQGNYGPDASALNMPYGLAVTKDWVIAADTANSRLIGWRHEDLVQGADAVGLAAQPDFGAKGDNRWQMPVRDSLCWPYNVTICGDTAVIADSGNNRVLIWDLAS